MVRLSGYHFFMDRLRSEGNLVFYCSDCETRAKVENKMPLFMKCLPPCEQIMVVMDTEDLP